ncbi:hypothetical protein [Dyadobacter sp. CY323]|uniref:hypothetical protein n=1 Tax=Dyadobacter sp. CY323 TaxID=2907302 RepID=UPI001F351163|nr:hypothetical protein [Dyadobacter sp. CY323]MCE6989505.1 hypothetical protein [Dyadobacter sp. CY323]
MKKIIVIGVITGVVVFVFLTSCSRQMEAKKGGEKKDTNLADKNKTEGYFYHQSEQDRSTDSTKIKKNVNN